MLNVESSSDKQQKSFNKVLLDDSKLSIENMTERETFSYSNRQQPCLATECCHNVTVLCCRADGGVWYKTTDYKLNFRLQRIAETFILTNC